MRSRLLGWYKSLMDRTACWLTYRPNTSPHPLSAATSHVVSRQLHLDVLHSPWTVSTQASVWWSRPVRLSTSDRPAGCWPCILYWYIICTTYLLCTWNTNYTSPHEAYQIQRRSNSAQRNDVLFDGYFIVYFEIDKRRYFISELPYRRKVYFAR